MTAPPDGDEWIATLTELEAQKDAAYLERNKLVALLASIFPAGIKQTAIEGWSEDWHGCVYIDFPWGQASWHYHDSQAALFQHLPPYAGEWDGHTTDQKYDAIQKASRDGPTMQAAIAAAEARGREQGQSWQPIATAPKDRLIDIWLSEGRRWCDCYYDRICDQWRTSRPGGRLVWVKAQYVTHWQDAPAPPPAGVTTNPSQAVPDTPTGD